MDLLKTTAQRALLFVAEGREQTDATIAKMDDGDYSVARQHEIERSLATIETGVRLLRAVLMVMSGNHPSAALPSERAQ